MRTRRVHNPVAPFAKTQNATGPHITFFRTQNPTGVRNASIIQSLCSQNIQIVPQSHSNTKTLQTPKIRNLGKQRERSLCSRKQPNFNKPLK